MWEQGTVLIVTKNATEHSKRTIRHNYALGEEVITTNSSRGDNVECIGTVGGLDQVVSNSCLSLPHFPAAQRVLKRR